MRNLLSLIKAVSWGQAWSADLLWSRIYSAYSLGWDSGTAGRAQERVSDDRMMINLIVTSTALNVRLVQEAHKRKLSAVSWVLLLREQRMQTNKPQHCLRLWPAKEQPGSPAQQCVCCLGMVVQPAWGPSPASGCSLVGWEAAHTSLRQWDQGRECAMGVSLWLTSQPALSAAHSGCLHGQAAWSVLQSRSDKTSRLQRGGLQIIKSHTLCTSARPHHLDKKTYGSSTGRNLFLG